MMKVKQKISGGFRSDDGANTFINRTVNSTAKKQGWSILNTLTQDPGSLIQTLKFA